MKQLWMDWQLFAEGESAPEGAGEGQDSTPPDAGEDFEALIRGRCKEEFDARVKKILDGRLRGLRQENQRLRQAESARQVQALERWSGTRRRCGRCIRRFRRRRSCATRISAG